MRIEYALRPIPAPTLTPVTPWRVSTKPGQPHHDPQSCLLIETRKFPILPGEDQEIVNEGMYGKAICEYLQAALPGSGLNVPFYCSEDWGWWLEVERGAFKMGLCIYSDPGADKDPERYAILPSIQQAKKWSWPTFRTTDHSGMCWN